MYPARSLAFVTPLTFSIFLTVTPAEAAPAAQCKSLTQEACAATPDCRWVEGYTRRDGRRVNAYCRKAPRPKSGEVLGGKAASGPEADRVKG